MGNSAHLPTWLPDPQAPFLKKKKKQAPFILAHWSIA
jgi:hypothetical protein